MYDSFTLTALKYCEGDQQAADYFLNCSVSEYYYRLKNKKQYSDWMQEQIKNRQSKSE